MEVRKVMSQDVRTVRASISVKEAARAMLESNVGALPVTDDERLLGLLTDRDIVTRVVAQGEDPEQVRVVDVMSQRVLYCFDDQDCDEVAKNMADQQVLRLPVVDREKRLVGIVSAGDLQARAGATEANDEEREDEDGEDDRELPETD